MKSIIARSPAMAGIVAATHSTSASHRHGSLPTHDDFIRTAPQRVDLAGTFRALATDISPPGKAWRLPTFDRLEGCARPATGGARVDRLSAGGQRRGQSCHGSTA